MTIYECIEVTTDNKNNIISCKIRGSDDKIYNNSAITTIDMIKQNRIRVLNMKVVNNKLCYKVLDKYTILKIKDIHEVESNNKLSFKVVDNMNNYTNKAAIVGYKTIRKDKYTVLISNTETIFVSENKFRLSNNNRNGFFEYSKFREIDMDNIDTSMMISFRAMFADCRANKINIKGMVTDNCEDMYCMFYNCDVDELDFSNFDTSNVKDYAYMFKFAKIKNKLDLQSFDVRMAHDLRHMFCNTNCSEIDISSFDTRANSHDDSVDTSNMFVNCCAKIKCNDANLLRQIKIDKENSREADSIILKTEI